MITGAPFPPPAERGQADAAAVFLAVVILFVSMLLALTLCAAYF